MDNKKDLFDILNSQQFEDEKIEAIQQSLDNGADINIKDEYGWSVLHRAISGNQLNIVKILVARGADLDAPNGNGMSCASLAAAEGNWSILKWLVEEQGAKIPLPNPKNSDTVENILAAMRNTYMFNRLNDQTDAVLVLGSSDSGTKVLAEYIVEDEVTCDILIPDDIIGENSTVRQNTIDTPAIIIEEWNDVIVYSCPDFGDVKAVFSDITSTYFLRKIIDYVDNVKIIFSVSYDMVNTEKTFSNFLRSATTFLEDTSSFDRSIGLVVTKFEDHHDYDDQGQSNQVALRLSTLKQFFDEKIGSKSFPEDEEFYSKATNLIDIFLSKRGDDYTHLAIFRSIREPETSFSVYGGRKSRELMANLAFASKDESDFRYSVLDKSKFLIYDLIERVNIGVTFDVISIANELRKYYETAVNRSRNMHKLQERLNTDSSVLYQMAAEALLSANPTELLNTIVRGLEKIDVGVSGRSLKSIKQWGHIMRHLEIVGGQNYKVATMDWVKPVKEVSEYLVGTNKWYVFLLDMYEKFSTYEMQKEKAKYNVANLNDWGQGSAKQGVSVSQDNWKQFMDVMKRYNIEEYTYVKDMPADKLKLRDLNHMLDLSFKEETEFLCEGRKRVARGNYVYLSDVVKRGCKGNTYYQVFALNTVFIDMNLNQCNLQGVIMAPKWEVIGKRTFGLIPEGRFLGIGETYSGEDNLYFTYTRGTAAASNITLIKTNSSIDTRIIGGLNIFTTSMPCVDRSRLVNLQPMSYNVEDYKSFLRGNLDDKVRQQLLVEFVKGFEEDTKVRSVYGPLGFVRELQNLENHFYRLSSRLDFLPFYQSLLNRMSDYTKDSNTENESPQLKKILTYSYTATLSKIAYLKYGADTNLVIDLKEYLDLAVDNIRELGEIEKNVRETSKKFEEISKKGMIEHYRNKYKSDIDKKIEEANYFINKHILPEIKNISDQIEREMLDLLREIDEIKEKVERQKEELEKIKKKIEHQIRLRTLLGAFKILGSFLSFFGPIGAIAGAAVNAAAGIAETFIPDSSEELNKLEQITLPEGINVERNLKKRDLRELGILDGLTVTSRQLLRQKSIYDSPTLEHQANDFIVGRLSTRSALKSELDRQFIRRPRDIDGSITAVGGSVTELLNNAKSDEQKLQVVKDAIENCKQQIEQLEEFKTYVREKVTPWIKNVLGDLQAQARNLRSKSHVALDVQQWQVQQKIKDMKRYLVEATKGFKVQKEFQRLIEKLDDAMNTLINVFDRIQTYEEHKKFADYIADISSVAYSNINISDVKLMNTTNNLERIITSNILLGHYNTAVSNFKQFTFPFADYFLAEFDVLSVLSESNDTQVLVDNAVKRISLMKSALIRSDTTINRRFDKHIFKADFNSENKLVGPFYVWNNYEYKDAIRRLLSGEEVALKADVMRTASDRNAVKFDFVELQFKTMNATRQSELESKLKYFAISMTHRGNSYYRCGSKFYIINTDSVTITYSLQKNAEGKPTSANAIYEKLRTGDLLLSPYTMWTVKLTPTSLNFRELRKYEHEVDLVLAGHGQHLSKDTDVCDHDLQKYYQVDETIDEIDHIEEEAPQILESETLHYRCASSGASISSPINSAIKWLAKKLLPKRPKSSGHPQAVVFEKYLGFDKSEPDGQFVLEPAKFYNQVDAGLVLAPVLLHLWNAFFHRQTVAKAAKARTVNRTKTWENWLVKADQLIGALQEVFAAEHAELEWYNDVLELRKQTVAQGTKLSQEEVDDLERNLAAFQIDLYDDLKYNKAFAAARNRKSVRVAMENLVRVLEELPGYRKQLRAENYHYNKYECEDDLLEKAFVQSRSTNQCSPCISRLEELANFKTWNVGKDSELKLL